ncbi:MAG: hypothetical protein WCL07_04410, partial [bacterium]
TKLGTTYVANAAVVAGAVVGGVAVAGAIPGIVTLAGTGTAGVTLTSLGQAAASVGGAAMATLPAAAQTTIGVVGSALTIGGTAAGAWDCAQSGGSGTLCNATREALFTGFAADPVATTEQYTSSVTNLITKPIGKAVNTVTNKVVDKYLGGLSGDFLVPLDQTTIALVGDLHADVDGTKEIFRNLGIVDEFGPTGRPFVSVGDFFGKNNTYVPPTPAGIDLQKYVEPLSTTPGIDTFEYVQHIQDVVGTERAILQAGNWEPRTAKAVVAYLGGNQQVVEDLMNKRLGKEEIETLASDPAKFASMLDRLDYVSMIDGQVVQHIDTPELAKLSLSSADLAKLQETNPALATKINELTNNSTTMLTAESMQTIREAQQTLELTSQQIIDNINNNAHSITSNALLNPTDKDAILALDKLGDMMNGELSFYGPEKSDLLSLYINDMLGADTLIHGHSPVSTIDKAVTGIDYAGTFVEPISGVKLINIDANNSSGMRLPGKFPTVNGVVQVPSDTILKEKTLVPTELIPTPTSLGGVVITPQFEPMLMYMYVSNNALLSQ